MGLLKLGLLSVWWQLITGQCYLQEMTTTQSEGVTLHTQEINIKEEILGFLSLTSLIKQENFLVKDNFIITAQNDPTCVYLGLGMRLHDIQKGLTDTWNLPLLTQAVILSQTRILLTTNKITTIVNKTEFTQLIQILGFEDQVDMQGHPNIVFILEGSRKILTNYNLKDRNVCMAPPTILNLSHKLLRLVEEMDLTWKQIKTANSLYGNIVDIDGFSKCTYSMNISFQELMLMATDNFDF